MNQGDVLGRFSVKGLATFHANVMHAGCHPTGIGLFFVRNGSLDGHMELVQ